MIRETTRRPAPRLPRPPATTGPRQAATHSVLLFFALAFFLLAQQARCEWISVQSFTNGDDDGPALILIPGLSSGGDVWDGTVEALENEHRLYVVTLAGFGGTPPADADGEPFLENVRDAILGLIDEEGLERPVIVGHSLGGFLAYWIAATDPEAVGGIVAVDGVPFYSALQNPEATPQSMAQAADQTRRMFESMTAEQFRLQNGMALDAMVSDPQQRERVGATSAESDPATVGRAMAELLVSDLRHDLARIEAPILQIAAVGAGTPEERRSFLAERYRQQIAAAPDAQLVEAPTAHFVMLDDPQFFLDTLRSFLGDLSLEDLRREDSL